MSKKHFRAIAKAMHELRGEYDARTLDAVAFRLCDTFRSINSNFQRDTFTYAVEHGL